MNLRTHNKYHNIAFNLEINPMVQITHKKIELDLPINNTLIMINNLLSPIECDEIIQKSNRFHCDILQEYSPEFRDSKRFLHKNKHLCEIIYDRIKNIIKSENQQFDLKPFGFGVDGQWEVCGLNNCFRHSKYESPSIGFKFHRDSNYVESENVRSIFTLIIYLNDDYDGGETIFIKPNTNRQVGQIVSEELEHGYTEIFKYKATKGSALIFNHDIIHCGNNITFGSKYIIRSDILFKNINPNNDQSWRSNKHYLQCIEFYREANNQEMMSCIELSGELYERGLALRQFH